MPGVTLEDFPEEVVTLHPDCALPVRVFDLLATQWRRGPGGAYGLDNAAIRPTVEMAGIAVDDWPLLLSDLRTLEAEALNTMHKGKP
jgi:hypothetical protein